MKISWRTEALPVILIAGMFIMVAIALPQAPDSIPIHWNAAGEPDGYAGKVFGLLIMPLITLGIYASIFVLPLIDPKGKNYERFWNVFLIIRTIIILPLVCGHTIIFFWAIGIEISVNTILPMVIGFMLIVLGNYMGKLRPTWFVGIRTPWTLSSEESWNKTHRLGGWLFVVSGLALVIAAAVLDGEQTTYAVLAAGIGPAVLLTIYSYFVWRKDSKTDSTKTRWADK